MKTTLVLASVLALTTTSLSAGGCASCARGTQYKSKSYGRQQNYNQIQKYSTSFDEKNDQYISADDKEILMDIKDTLRANNFDTRNNSVHFLVEYGKVKVTGRVNTPQERQDLEQYVTNTPAVKHVVFDVYVDDRTPKQNNGKQNGNQREPHHGNEMGYLSSAQMETGNLKSKPALSATIEKTQQNGQLTDQQLEQNIKDMLAAGWFAKTFENVMVKASNGNVTLSGTVQTEMDKRFLENKVKKVAGVQQVTNNVEVAEKAQPSAARTMPGRPAPRGNDMNQVSSIQVQTGDGQNYQGQTGQMRNYQEQTPNMQNSLYGSPLSDQQLEQNVKDMIKAGWFAKTFENIQIKASNGNVTLSGTVASELDKRLLESKVKAVSGVQSVTNNVQVSEKSQAGATRYNLR